MRQLMMQFKGEWRWYCNECHEDLGPQVGKHKTKCPKCGSKSAYCTRRGSNPEQVRLSKPTAARNSNLTRTYSNLTAARS